MGTDFLSETLRSIGTIIVVAQTGAAIGLLLGCLLGSLAPDLFRALDTSVLALIVVEGLLYSGGAIMLGVRWPDLSPRVFGYHEVWHALVTAAVAIHFVVVAMIVGAG